MPILSKKRKGKRFSKNKSPNKKRVSKKKRIRKMRGGAGFSSNKDCDNGLVYRSHGKRTGCYPKPIGYGHKTNTKKHNSVGETITVEESLSCTSDKDCKSPPYTKCYLGNSENNAYNGICVTQKFYDNSFEKGLVGMSL